MKETEGVLQLSRVLFRIFKSKLGMSAKHCTVISLRLSAVGAVVSFMIIFWLISV